MNSPFISLAIDGKSSHYIPYCYPYINNRIILAVLVKRKSHSVIHSVNMKVYDVVLLYVTQMHCVFGC